jgi:DNA-binding NarL/FixJ family response regulator
MIQKSKIKLLFISLFAFTLFTTFAQNKNFDSLADEVNRISIYKKTEALRLLDSLYQMAHHGKDSTLLIARCLSEEAVLNLRQGISDSCLSYKIEKKLNRNNIQKQEKALFQFAMGTSLASEKKYGDAFHYLLDASENFKKLNEDRFTAQSLSFLGNICFIIGMWKLADYYYSEASTYANPELSIYYYIKLNHYSLMSYLNKDEAVNDALLLLLEVVERKELEELMPIFYLNIGAMFLNEAPEKALFYFSKLQNLDFDNPISMAILYSNMGKYYLNNNDLKHASIYYNKAQKIMEQNNTLNNLISLYYDISLVFERENRLDSALLYSRKHQELSQKLQSNTIAIEKHQKNITSILESSQKDLIISKQKIELGNRRFVFLVVIFSFVVVVVLLLVAIINLRKNQKTLELTTKINLQTLEKEAQKEILEANTREISSYSLLVSNKNEILNKIMRLCEQIINNKEDADKTVKKIIEIIKSNLSIDKEWENFKLHFEKVHPIFFEKLKQSCNELTEENLKTCAYIKIGMSNKQIAQLLNVAHNSIIISRYRIRKKLQLPDNEDLKTFLDNLQ